MTAAAQRRKASKAGYARFVEMDSVERLDEPRAVKSRVCLGQRVSEGMRHAEDRACLGRCVVRLRLAVCSTEHPRDQLLSHHGLTV
jgi:hypothetical protein